jgi:hypothetical protein
MALVGCAEILKETLVTHLQKLRAMQLSQLEKASPTSPTVSVIWRDSMFLASPAAMEPHMPPLRLLAMATSTEGISECTAAFLWGMGGGVPELVGSVEWVRSYVEGSESGQDYGAIPCTM